MMLIVTGVHRIRGLFPYPEVRGRIADVQRWGRRGATAGSRRASVAGMGSRSGGAEGWQRARVEVREEQSREQGNSRNGEVVDFPAR